MYVPRQPITVLRSMCISSEMLASSNNVVCGVCFLVGTDSPMPDIEVLMREWPAEYEETLKKVSRDNNAAQTHTRTQTHFTATVLRDMEILNHSVPVSVASSRSFIYFEVHNYV